MTLKMDMSRLFRPLVLTPGLAVCVLALAACSGGSDSTGKSAKANAGAATVEITDAWCRPTPNGAHTGACYMTLKAEGAAETLMGVASPAAASVQIHSGATADGQMSMAPLEAGLTLPVNQAVTLSPGHNHIMLMNLTRPLVAGDTVSLTLGFQRIAAMTVQAEVRLPQVETGAATPAKK